MSATSTRSTTVIYTGDVAGTEVGAAAANTTSPAQIQVVALTTGNNAIQGPAGATAVTVTKPTTNAVAITLKGVNGDTGILLHVTDPDSLSLGSNAGLPVPFVLSAAAPVTVRLFWT